MWQDWTAWLLATGCFSSIREQGMACQTITVSAYVEVGSFTFVQELFDKIPHKLLGDNLNALKSSTCEFLSVYQGIS